jgi:DNA-binding response OmpR family regulator
MKILLLEDDYTLSKEIKHFLISKEFECDALYDGSLFFKQIKLAQYDLYLLDINVPGTNGLEICKQVRQQDSETPILMLTAFGEVLDKVAAFTYGADDYLVKPFHFEELLVRIMALLRRKNNPQKKEEKICLDDLVIDVTESKVTRGQTEIFLSQKEYHLLLLLANAKGRPVSKQTIAEQIWDYNVDASQNTIQVYINFLRKKIDGLSDVKLIHTRVGFGYYLKSE